jgi:hypothetical protein
MKRARPRLSYANVVSTISLFLVLSGGVAFAAKKLTTNDIKKGAIKTKLLAKHAVTNAKLAKNAVKSKNIAANAVRTTQIAADSVNGSKVLNGSLTPADVLGGGSVVATATGGPVDVGSGPTPVPLSGGTWTQGATENDLFVAKLEGTVSVEGSGSCQVFVNLELDGVSIGALALFGTSATPTALTSEQLSSARIAPGVATPRQLKASASSFAFTGSCKTTHISSFRVSVLGVG